jgi:hypothetical protein
MVAHMDIAVAAVALTAAMIVAGLIGIRGFRRRAID